MVNGRKHRGNITSKCGKIITSGSLSHIINRYEAMAEKETEQTKKHLFLNHSEHYGKILHGLIV